MEITINKEASPCEITLVGRLDTLTSPQLEAAANELHEQGINDIIVNMGSCDFVSSAGLRVIAAMQKRAAVEGSLVFANSLPEVLEIFEITGFDNILTLR